MSTTHEDVATNEAAARTAALAEATPGVDAPKTPPVGDPPRHRGPRHGFGWVLAVAGLAGIAGLAVALIVDDGSNFPGTQGDGAAVGDAKDHPNYGPVTITATTTGDAKDHPNYGPVTNTATTTGDAKDHPNYGLVTNTATPTGDSKDHPNYGPVTGCRTIPEQTELDCPAQN